MDIKKLKDTTLWAMLSDIAEILSKHAKEDTEVITYWYLLYTEIQKEVDSRMIREGANDEQNTEN